MHNSLIKEVLKAFRLRFAPRGRVLWVSEGNEPVLAARNVLAELGVSLLRPHDLPSVVIFDKQSGWMVLIDVAELRGLINRKRREALTNIFGGCKLKLRFVSAFRSRRQLQKSLASPAWETVVWFADEPTHLVHFNGTNLFGPTTT
jgi:hypothetical protein